MSVNLTLFRAIYGPFDSVKQIEDILVENKVEKYHFYIANCTDGLYAVTKETTTHREFENFSKLFPIGYPAQVYPIAETTEMSFDKVRSSKILYTQRG